jgi:ABC-type phosphate transport system substrate-binding protein
MTRPVFATTMPALRGALLLLACLAAPVRADVVVIGHPGLPRVDAATVQKIFTGRVIEVTGIGVTAINMPAGTQAREHFLQALMEQNEEKYSAYWTVRRYIGKGAPPREITTSAEVIRYVQNTPGAIGYVEETDLRPGLNILLRK